MAKPTAIEVEEQSPIFDPMSLLTPDAIAGIKPLLRVALDGMHDVPFISANMAKSARHTAAWLQQILDHVEAQGV